MLTKTNPDGTWSCQGVDLSEVRGNLYGALCKLRDYEKSGFEPDDLERVKSNIHIGSHVNGYVVFGVWAGHYFGSREEAERGFFMRCIGAKPNKDEYWKR